MQRTSSSPQMLPPPHDHLQTQQTQHAAPACLRPPAVQGPNHRAGHNSSWTLQVFPCSPALQRCPQLREEAGGVSRSKPPLLRQPLLPLLLTMAGGAQAPPGVRRDGCPRRTTNSTFLQWFHWLISLFRLPGAPRIFTTGTPPKKLNVASGLWLSQGSARSGTDREHRGPTAGRLRQQGGNSRNEEWSPSRVSASETLQLMERQHLLLPPRAVTPQNLPTSLAWHQGTEVVASVKDTGTYPRPLWAQDAENKSLFLKCRKSTTGAAPDAT